MHLQDLHLVKEGKIPISSLITIRKGELVHNPISNTVQPAAVELVKLVGTGRRWDCCYYDSASGCTIYGYRPHACRVLKCWDEAELLSIIEKDTLDRLAILEEDDPLADVIREHERICPCDGLEEVLTSYDSLSGEKKAEIENLVRYDLHFRERVVKDFELKLSEELFYFGRPIFQLLQPLGVRIVEAKDGIHLRW